MADNNTIILKLQLEEAQSKVKIKKLNQELEDLDGRTKEYRESVAKLNLEEQKLINTRKKLSQSTTELIGDNKQGLNGVSKASGGATAAAMELGRVVSDAPYGIRGMANNVSQLASQLFYMAGQQVTATTATNTDTVAKGANTTATVVATGATVGFAGALRMMWSALMGPMGVLLGIQAVISGLDFFYGANKKAEDSVGDLNKAIGGTAGANTKLLAYSEIIKTSSKDTKEYKNALKELKSKGYDPASESLDNFINKQLKLLVIRAKSKVIEDELNKLFTEQVAKESKLREQQQRIDALEIKKDKEKNKVKRDRIQNNIDYIESQKEVVVIDEKYKKLQKELIDLTTEEFKLIDNISKNGEDGKKISPFKTKEALELDVKSNEAALLSYSNKIQMQELKNAQAEELLNAKTSKEKDVIKRKYEEKFLRLQLDNEFKILKLKKETEKQVFEAKYKTFQEEAKLRFLAYEDSIKKNDKLSEAQKESLIGSARTDTSKLLSDSFEERNKELGEGGTLEEKYKTLFETFNKLKKSRLDALGIGSGDKEEGADGSTELDKITSFVEGYKTLMSGIGDFLQAEADRELTIEQNKTNVLNEELNKRLLNENLSENERKSIQDQILKNDEDLRVKQNKIKKKAFDTQKALNISMAIANTIAAGIGAANQSYGGPFARIAAMTAVIGAGMAQVAVIARQKFQPDSPNTPINTGGGGTSEGTTQRAEPSFNIVGGSRENQLLTAIQSQFDKPLKAYVVSTEVTDQQQLDSVIVNTAGT